MLVFFDVFFSFLRVSRISYFQDRENVSYKTDLISFEVDVNLKRRNTWNVPTYYSKKKLENEN